MIDIHEFQNLLFYKKKKVIEKMSKTRHYFKFWKQFIKYVCMYTPAKYGMWSAPPQCSTDRGFLF